MEDARKNGEKGKENQAERLELESLTGKKCESRVGKRNGGRGRENQ